jgi:Na+/proline symporter
VTPLDWTVFAAYLALVLWIGYRASRRVQGGADEYLLAGRSIPWWAVGLSIMATQASAITVIGTTGQAFRHGMGFAQFYLGLPVAMAILAFTLLPLYRRANVSTAYELLGHRFDDRTRLATAILFLLSRGLALGVVVYAPSVVLSLLLGWSTEACVAAMTVVALGYTVMGGLRAVIVTDVIQMALVLGGLVVALVMMLGGLPDGANLSGLLDLAGAGERTQVLDWSFDPSAKYTVWSGLLGGTFLFLAYFGCDQSQVQRLLAAKSLSDGRSALLLNGLAKIPLQLFVLFVGVVMFGALQFDDEQPLLFDGRVEPAIEAAGLGSDLDGLRARHGQALEARHAAALPTARAGWDPAANGSDQAAWIAAQDELDAVRADALALAERAGVEDADDTNHVFPWFLVNRLPIGLVGLLVAAVFAAAMSSIDSELNALATTTVVDVYQHHLRPDADDRTLVRVGRLATVVWALLAAAFALKAAALGSVIEAVNTVGSYFYGSLLGVFVLAFAFKRATGRGAFWGLFAGMGAVAVAQAADLAWLWLNPIGCLAAVAAGVLMSGRGSISSRSA